MPRQAPNNYAQIIPQTMCSLTTNSAICSEITPTLLHNIRSLPYTQQLSDCWPPTVPRVTVGRLRLLYLPYRSIDAEDLGRCCYMTDRVFSRLPTKGIAISLSWDLRWDQMRPHEQLWKVSATVSAEVRLWSLYDKMCWDLQIASAVQTSVGCFCCIITGSITPSSPRPTGKLIITQKTIFLCQKSHREESNRTQRQNKDTFEAEFDTWATFVLNIIHVGDIYIVPFVCDCRTITR